MFFLTDKGGGGGTTDFQAKKHVRLYRSQYTTVYLNYNLSKYFLNEFTINDHLISSFRSF